MLTLHQLHAHLSESSGLLSHGSDNLNQGNCGGIPPAWSGEGIRSLSLTSPFTHAGKRVTDNLVTPYTSTHLWSFSSDSCLALSIQLALFSSNSSFVFYNPNKQR